MGKCAQINTKTHLYDLSVEEDQGEAISARQHKHTHPRTPKTHTDTHRHTHIHTHTHTQHTLENHTGSLYNYAQALHVSGDAVNVAEAVAVYEKALASTHISNTSSSTDLLCAAAVRLSLSLSRSVSLSLSRSVSLFLYLSHTLSRARSSLTLSLSLASSYISNE